MTGLIYKEVRQNRLMFWTAGLTAPICLLLYIAMMLLVSIVNDTAFQTIYAEFAMTTESGLSLPLIQFYSCLFPLVMIGLISLNLFAQDGTKKWGYFTASHPKGISGALYAKYVLIFMLSVLVFVSVSLTEEIIFLLDHLILGKKMGDMQSYQMIYIILFFFQIFLRMGDIPFIVRFGKKRGETLKVVLVSGIFMGAIIYVLFGPLPGEDGEFFIQIYDWWQSFMQGAAQDWVYFLLAGFLWLTIIGYYVSYKLSCKLYLKGVEQYDK